MVTKKTIHITLIAILLIGTLFAWYNTAKEAGLFGECTTGCSITSTMLGLPICVWGAIFFTISLILAIILWYR